MSHKILDFLLPYRKLKKDISFFKKVTIYFEIFFNIIAASLIISYFGLPFLGTTVKYKNLQFHSLDTEINATLIKKYLIRADGYLIKNPLYTDNKTIDIFLLNNSILYAIMNPLQVINGFNSYAATFGANVTIKKVDLKNNKCFSYDGTENFDAVLAHELTHAYQNSKYGFFIKYKSSWIVEGYATYASRDLYIEKPKEILENYIKHYPEYENLPSKHLSKQYQVWMLMVKHAIEYMHKSVDDVHLGKVSYDEVMASLEEIERLKLQLEERDNQIKMLKDILTSKQN